MVKRKRNQQRGFLFDAMKPPKKYTYASMSGSGVDWGYGIGGPVRVGGSRLGITERSHRRAKEAFGSGYAEGYSGYDIEKPKSRKRRKSRKR